MLSPRLFILVVFACMTLLPGTLTAAEQQKSGQRPGPQAGWSSFASGGSVYKFDKDLDGGGSYNVTRFSIQAGHGYGGDPRTNASLTLGYRYDGYSFSKGNGLAAIAPWKDVNTFSLGLPIRMGLGSEWSVFLLPSIQSTGESASTFAKTMTGGILTGFSYRFNDRLTFGPGLGVASQLEESPTFFPFFMINWNITDKLSLDTGRGLSASLGPGLALNYQANRHWSFGIGGRYEKLRFRLKKNSAVPDGIGEDKSFPVFASCSYSLNSKTQINLVGGVEVGSQLVLEDKSGNLIAKEAADPGGFMGITFSVRM